MKPYVIAMIVISVILAVFIGIITFDVAKYFLYEEQRQKINRNIRKYGTRTIENIDKNTQLISGLVGRTIYFLSSSGANYMLRRKINPLMFWLLSAGTGAAAAFFISRMYGLFPTIAAGAAGVVLPAAILSLSNKKDNGAMLRDINSIYDSLCLQTAAGMYLSEALKECSIGVHTPRLKKALSELNLNIEMSRFDIEEALDDFNSKFNNKHIDMLVLVLKQSLKSGLATQYLKDLQDQMADVQKEIEAKKEQQANSKLMAVELLVFIAVLVVIVAVLIYELIFNMSAL